MLPFTEKQKSHGKLTKKLLIPPAKSSPGPSMVLVVALISSDSDGMAWRCCGGAQLSQILFRIFRDFCVSLGVFVQDLFFWGGRKHKEDRRHMQGGLGGWWFDELLLGEGRSPKAKIFQQMDVKMISSKKKRLEPFEFHFSMFIPKLVFVEGDLIFPWAAALGHIWTHRQDDFRSRLLFGVVAFTNHQSNLGTHITYIWHKDIWYMITVRIANLIKINNLQTTIEHYFH